MTSIRGRMGKLVLVALLAVASFRCPMPDPVITISPMPPTEGQDVTVSLVGGDENALLTVELIPGGMMEIRLKGGSKTFKVPRGTGAMIVSGGGAVPVSTSVTPG